VVTALKAGSRSFARRRGHTIGPVSGATAVRADRTGVLLTALSAACFGSLAIYGKFADRMGIPLTELLAIRFGLAAVILWTLAAVRHQRLWWGRRTAGLAVMGLLYVGQAATYFTSLKTVPAAVTSILLYLYPVIVMLLAAVFLGERLGRVRVAALLIAVAGVFAVVDPLSAHGSIDRAGVLFGLATAAIYATYILTGRVLLRDVPAVVATAAIATTAGVTLAIAGAAGGQLRPLSAGGYALAGSMAIVATAIPATLFLAGLARIGATRAAIISTLEPATTVVLAALLLGEGLGAIRLLGGAVVLVAAVVVARNVPPDLAEPRVRE
jgi:drug/metabolite transporter (DMT)-like permease